MKKLMLLITILGLFGSTAFASISLNLYVLKIDIQGDVNAKALYDNLNTKIWYDGADTTIGYVPFFRGAKLDLALGETTNPSEIPFLSLAYNWKANTSALLTQIGLPELAFGIWTGYDGIIDGQDYTKHVHGGFCVSANIIPKLLK